MSVINNVRRDGGTPSFESIATQLSSSMHTTQRALALLGLQRTHGNRYVQRVVEGIQAKLVVGQPLSENDRAFFEPRFGRDFSQVLVHSDSQASESARAFTVEQ